RDPLREAAVVGAVAGEARPLAQVGMAVAAGRAVGARQRGVHRHAPAVLGDAAELVAQHERARRAGDAADPALHEPVDVRPAQADRAHAHQRLAGRGPRPLLLVEPQVAPAVQPRHAHRHFSAKSCTITTPWGLTSAENSPSNEPRSFCRQRSRTRRFPAILRSAQRAVTFAGFVLRLKSPAARDPSSIGRASTSRTFGISVFWRPSNTSAPGSSGFGTCDTVTACWPRGSWLTASTSSLLSRLTVKSS